MMAKARREIIDVAGIATELLWLPATAPATSLTARSQQPNSLLFVIPGNPGSIDYYEPFLYSLQSIFPDRPIVGVSHAGHSAHVNTAGKVFDLAQQISHKMGTISHVLARDRAERGLTTEPAHLIGID